MKKINGVVVKTVKKEITSANVLEVEVGTTGYCGGDSGHGGRTYFAIKDLASTDINANLLYDKFNRVKGIEIMLGGDTELSTFIEALEFAVKTLKEQSKE